MTLIDKCDGSWWLPSGDCDPGRRKAARRGHSMQQEFREVLDKAAAEAAAEPRSRGLRLRTVATGRTEDFDRADFYGDDGR